MPKAGHEQGGRRPALILSPCEYNANARLALACPITNQIKGYPFEVPIPPGRGIVGVVLADHIKNLDWHARGAAFGANGPAGVVAEVRERPRPLLGCESGGDLIIRTDWVAATGQVPHGLVAIRIPKHTIPSPLVETKRVARGATARH